MEKKEKTALDELKEHIVAVASEAVVSQMTPTQMRKVSEQVIETVLSGINTDKYSTLAQIVERKAETMLKDYLKSEEVTSSVRVAVRQGVDAALREMPEQVKGKVVDVALRGMVDALQSKTRR